MPYSEYEVINQLQKRLPKGEGYSYHIPTSRQQKGVDFIIHGKKRKFLKFQVKSSRSYADEPRELKSGRIIYTHNLWFNNFIDRYEKGNADYYILFGLYPQYQKSKNIKSQFWKPIILCFSEKEIFSLLKNVKAKNGKKDIFFGIGFNEGAREIFGARGFKNSNNLSKFLFKNKLAELKRRLE